jgi:GT2 family glycosyltransferase
MTRRLSVSVVVPTASHEREPLLHACVASLLQGGRVPDELFVVVDHNPQLEAKLADSLPAEIGLLRSERPGSSGSKNTGIRVASSDIVAFVDDDATVEPDWLCSLVEPLEASDELIGVGGAVVPAWGTDGRSLPDELLWLVGCTYRGHRQDAGPIRNPIGCNMAFRRRELLALGSFAAEFGRPRNVYCDETELGLRLERTHGPGRIRYVPAARVHHHIPERRLGWRVLIARCVREGLSKGRLHRLYHGAALASERGYVRRVLLDAVPRLLVRGIHGRDRRSMLNGAMILVALLVTAAAFVVGVATAGRRSTTPAAVPLDASGWRRDHPGLAPRA